MPERLSWTSLQVEPEPLFHDEEIAFSGINIHNPLWDTGDSSFSDEDPLMSPIKPLVKPLYPPKRSPPPSKPKSACRQSLERFAKAAVFIAVVCGFAGLVAVSSFQSTEVWASPGLIGDDDNVDLEVISSIQSMEVGNSSGLIGDNNNNLGLEIIGPESKCPILEDEDSPTTPSDRDESSRLFEGDC